MVGSFKWSSWYTCRTGFVFSKSLFFGKYHEMKKNLYRKKSESTSIFFFFLLFFKSNRFVNENKRKNRSISGGTTINLKPVKGLLKKPWVSFGLDKSQTKPDMA